MDQSQESHLAVAIIGGGPSGLTLARLLEKQNIDYVVYERNLSTTSVVQGGSLDLHPNSGQLALQEAGLFDEFQKVARYNATTWKLFDIHAKLFAEHGQERDAPEIDRVELRKILLNSVPKERVQWGKKVRSVKKSEGSGIVLYFEDGTLASGFRLVVGADGIWSKVRPLVTSAEPEYSGYHYIETAITPSNPYYGTVRERAGLGTVFAVGEGKQLIVQANGDGSYKIYLGLRAPEDFARNGSVDLSDGAGARKAFVGKEEYYANWSAELRGIISNSEGPIRPWGLYYMPTDALSWESVPGVTLVGDAAHVTTPFVGEGVNCSMFDSLTLARKISEHGLGEGLLKAVSEYEREMFERGKDLIFRSKKSGELIFPQGSPQSLVDAFTGEKSLLSA